MRVTLAQGDRGPAYVPALAEKPAVPIAEQGPANHPKRLPDHVGRGGREAKSTPTLFTDEAKNRVLVPRIKEDKERLSLLSAP